MRCSRRCNGPGCVNIVRTLLVAASLSEFISLAKMIVGDEELEVVDRVMRSGMVVQGQRSRRLRRSSRRISFPVGSPLR